MERQPGEIKKYADAGYDHLWIHQIGRDQEGFFKYYEDEVLPKLRGSKVVTSASA